MITAFLAAKKTAEIRSFIMVLLGFTLWTGGSILMRLQVFPGVSFWYYVSIMALFALPLLLYFFVCSFARIKGKFLKTVWAVGTLIILAITPTGIFLAPPEIVYLSNGGIGFTYTMDWLIFIPSLFALIIVISIIKIFLDIIKARGIRTPGLFAIIVGGIIVIIGNLVQLIPGNVFPWDTLSGIVFAAMLTATRQTPYLPLLRQSTQRITIRQDTAEMWQDTLQFWQRQKVCHPTKSK